MTITSLQTNVRVRSRAFTAMVTRCSCLTVVAAMALPAFLGVALSGCDTSHTVVDCVLGAHHPPGREDLCIANAIPSSTRARLLAAARSAARANHGTVTRAVAVESLRANAVHATTGAAVTGGGLVWVVEITGRFRCGGDCIGMLGAPAPSGTVLTLFIDTTSFEPSGLSLTSKGVDLSHLGPIVILQR